ncbi:MAG: permease prefix domain 1-containing protein [Terriglobales bacterium]
MLGDGRLREELGEHRRMLTEEYQRQGMSPRAARRAARLKLGGE